MNSPKNFDVISMDRDDVVEATLRQVADLKRQAVPIKLYRFGFLRLQFNQSRLEEGNSLHLWLPESLPCDEAPHLHNCRIQSRVLAGKIINLEWSNPEVNNEGEYKWVKTICSDTVCQDVSTGDTASVKLQGKEALGPSEGNDSYEIPVGQFHSTELAGNALTIIRKSDFITDPKQPIDNLLPLMTAAKTEPFDIREFNQRTAWVELDRALAEL